MHVKFNIQESSVVGLSRDTASCMTTAANSLAYRYDINCALHRLQLCVKESTCGSHGFYPGGVPRITQAGGSRASPRP